MGKAKELPGGPGGGPTPDTPMGVLLTLALKGRQPGSLWTLSKSSGDSELGWGTGS